LLLYLTPPSSSSHSSPSFGIAVSSYMVLMQETPLSSPQIILHVLGVQLPLKIVCFYI